MTKLPVYSHVNYSEPCESEAGAAEYIDLWNKTIIVLAKDLDIFIRLSPRIEKDVTTKGGVDTTTWIAKTRFSFGLVRK